MNNNQKKWTGSELVIFDNNRCKYGGVIKVLLDTAVKRNELNENEWPEENLVTLSWKTIWSEIERQKIT